MEELGHRRVRASTGSSRLSYRLLGLISFLTAGPDEVRAWPIPDGSTAVDAAGAIHTDLAKGFIRAETVAYEDLLALGSMAEARKARQAPLGGQDLPGPRRRRARDPVQQVARTGRGRSVQAAARVEVDEDRLEVDVARRRRRRHRHRRRPRPRRPGRPRGPARKLSLLVRRDVDRGGQPVVADVDEAVVALELVGDRLDEGIVVVACPGSGGGSSGRARRTPRAPTRTRGRGGRPSRPRRRPRAARRRTRSTPMRRGSGPAVYARRCRWPGRRVEVVHVGSACRDIAPDDPRGWRLGGGVTYAALTHGPARAADGGGRRRRRARPRRATSSTCCATPASTSCSCRSPRARSSTTSRRRRAGPDLRRASASRCRSRPLPAAWRRRAAGRSCRSPASSPTPGPTVVPPDAPTSAVGWQGLLRDLRAGRAGRAAGRRGRRRSLAPGGPRRGQPPRRRPGDADRGRCAALLQPGADLLVTQGARGRPADRTSGADGPAEVAALPADRDRPRDSTRPAPATRSSPRSCASVLRPAIVGRRRSRRPLDLRFAAAAGSLVVEGPGSPASRTAPRSSSGGRGSGSAGRSSRATAPQVGARRRRSDDRRVEPTAPARRPSRRRSRRAAPRRSASSRGSGRPSRRARSATASPRGDGRERAAGGRAGGARAASRARSRR